MRKRGRLGHVVFERGLCRNVPVFLSALTIRKEMCLVVKAVESVCGDHRRKVKAAVLSFIKELFRSGVDDCSAWGLVAYIFQEFSRATSRLETGNLSEIEVLEETALQTLCLQVLDSLDVSVSGMARLLWPRLLQYVVPAQYTGTLIPLSRCLRALLERQERAEEQKEEPNYLGYQEHATMPTPQALLLRLLLLACSPYGGGGRGVAALQLLQALRRQIHRAVGIPWMVQIPSLLQYLEGKDESSLDYAEWECLLLKTSHDSMCLLTSVLLRAGAIPGAAVHAVFAWLDSPSANLRSMATSFFAELMKDPLLQERKLLQPVLRALLDRCLDTSCTVRQMAVRGLGNLASGAPEELRKHKAAVVEALLRATRDVSSLQIAGESLSALAKVVAELQEKALGVTFRDIALCASAFFDAKEALARSSAFTLYGILASSAKRKWRPFLRQEVESTWARILLHLRDPDPGVRNACRSTFLLCTPLLGLQKLQAHVALNTQKRAEELQETVCSHLARNTPELLESLYDTLQTYFWSSCWGMRTAAITLTGVILENADARWLREHDMSLLSAILQLLQEDRHPSVQQAAAQVLSDNWPELRNA
nr:PREDICTED: maestro heat-like repeat-containing protein family member 2B [Struthio camelus australis]